MERKVRQKKGQEKGWQEQASGSREQETAGWQEKGPEEKIDIEVQTNIALVAIYILYEASSRGSVHSSIAYEIKNYAIEL